MSVVVGSVGEKVKLASGSGEPTTTVSVVEAETPPLSVTVRITMYVPVLSYSCVTLDPLASSPSPNSHSNLVRNRPAGAVEVVPSKLTVSLAKGAKINKFFNIVKRIRKQTDIPLILMTYTNILYHKGYSKFISDAKKVGIDGFILPDMSIAESKE